MAIMKSLNIGNFTGEIPSKTSDLTNDSGFVDAAGAAAAAPVKSVNGKTGIVMINAADIGTSNPEPCIVNMFDYFWANGDVNLSTQIQTDADGASKYLVVSGSEGDTTVTIDASSPLALGDLKSNMALSGIAEFDDGTLGLLSLHVENGGLSVYPPLKDDMTLGKIWALGVGIHLTEAGYKYYTECFFNTNRKYTRKSKAIAQYNPFSSITPNPLTKIGTYWWGAGVRNVCNTVFRTIMNGRKDYLNCSFVTGATAQSPKGFEWQETLDGKSGYFEMYIGGRDNTPMSAEFAAGFEFTIEWYLDGVLTETYVKKTKQMEPVRFDFSGAQTGKVKMYVTTGESNYEAWITQITWWLTDETDGKIFEDYKVPCLLMDSWGVYHNNAVQTRLEELLTTANGMPGYVVNNSLGSQTSNWGVENFYPKAWGEHPDYMITDFQINDINLGVTEAQYITNMKNIIDASESTWIQPVVLLSAHNNTGGIYSSYTFPLIAGLTVIPT